MAIPPTLSQINGTHFHIMSYCISYQSRRAIKTHWLSIENRAEKLRREIALHIGRGENKQGKRSGVALRKSIIGKCLQLKCNSLNSLSRKTIARHSFSQQYTKFVHLLQRALVAHDAPQA